MMNKEMNRNTILTDAFHVALASYVVGENPGIVKEGATHDLLALTHYKVVLVDGLSDITLNAEEKTLFVPTQMITKCVRAKEKGENLIQKAYKLLQLNSQNLGGEPPEELTIATNLARFLTDSRNRERGQFPTRQIMKACVRLLEQKRLVSFAIVIYLIYSRMQEMGEGDLSFEDKTELTNVITESMTMGQKMYYVDLITRVYCINGLRGITPALIKVHLASNDLEESEISNEEIYIDLIRDSLAKINILIRSVESEGNVFVRKINMREDAILGVSLNNHLKGKSEVDNDISEWYKKKLEQARDKLVLLNETTDLIEFESYEKGFDLVYDILETPHQYRIEIEDNND
jgi:hypothetical protein